MARSIIKMEVWTDLITLYPSWWIFAAVMLSSLTYCRTLMQYICPNSINLQAMGLVMVDTSTSLICYVVCYIVFIVNKCLSFFEFWYWPHHFPAQLVSGDSSVGLVWEGSHPGDFEGSGRPFQNLRLGREFFHNYPGNIPRCLREKNSVSKLCLKNVV